MNKELRGKLEKINEEVANKMLTALGDDDLEAMSDLSVIVTYLKNNQVFTPPDEEEGMHSKVGKIVK